ncbi:2Fe-2S iron-sulfur cluster binding domain-containing protein [Phyllobacterium sp. SYP-B3895]|uniref:hybrid-cluster NAD(P)-dependent oxidoreductase n=1 Tax=Phyllobacterium sp. SYP-B3895 TaxID=2663240 RepID=UPI001299E810|nr:hybrid-cluster NAD(P)-dependent oxidoreductase [Phyllobacterium sp. SYP-B3895]MRG57490.1 2Fe-2S iron-sulfur cluster binding domain-containing protein [Phyllobacterium sp. SYP-B3895]
MLSPLSCSQDDLYWDPALNQRMTCADIRDETHDVKTFTFVCSERRYFNFSAGQYFSFEVETGGIVERRCYSISSSPLRPRSISITVKRVEGGLVSNWLHDNLAPGMEIQAQGPVGNFRVPTESEGKYLFLSGGSGITPLMSIVRAYDDAHVFPDIAFLHAGRTPQDFIFHDELEFRARTMRNFRLMLLPERMGSKPGFVGVVGRLSKEYLGSAVPDLAERFTMCCGPAPFMAAVRGILGELGADPTRYLEESFDPLSDDVAVAAESVGEAIVPKFKVTFARQAKAIEVSASQSILSAAKKSGVRLPSSCASGICGTCKSKLVSGKVDMQHGGGIRQREIDAGMFLPCCSKPLTDLVVDR